VTPEGVEMPKGGEAAEAGASSKAPHDPKHNLD